MQAVLFQVCCAQVWLLLLVCAALHALMQTYTYDIRPIKDTSRSDNQLLLLGSSAVTAAQDAGTAAATTPHPLANPDSKNVHSFEVSCHNGGVAGQLSSPVHRNGAACDACTT